MSPGAGAYNAWTPRPKPGAWLPTVSGRKQSEQGALLPGLRPVEKRGRRAVRARHASPGTTGAAMRHGAIAFQWRSNPGSGSPPEIGRCRRSSRVFRTYVSRRARTGKATTAREPEFGFRVLPEEVFSKIPIRSACRRHWRNSPASGANAHRCSRRTGLQTRSLPRGLATMEVCGAGKPVRRAFQDVSAGNQSSMDAGNIAGFGEYIDIP